MSRWNASAAHAALRFALPLALLAWATSASAFCRTTTCDPNASCAVKPEDCCIFDEFNCDVNGIPLSWPTSCVSYSTHEVGSALRGISPEQLRGIIAASYDAWLASDCGGPSLSIAVEDRGFASCGEPEFNEAQDAKNANVWMFREDASATSGGAFSGNTIDAAALAVSIVSYDFKTGEIVDVDVELNSDRSAFTTSDDPAETVMDLQSVVTHEAGHFLGLDHTPVQAATMDSDYRAGTLDQRSLHPDDEAGLCAIYPEDRAISPGDQTCQPRGGYSPDCYEEKGCGCSTVGTDRPAPFPLVWLVVGVAGLAWRRNRRGPAVRG